MFDKMDKKKKNIAIIVGVVVLVIILIAVIVAVTRKPKKEPAKMNSSKKAMDAICDATDYKDTCKSKLTASGGDELVDPKEFIKLGVEVAQKEVSGLMYNIIHRYADEYKDPGVRYAFRTCELLLNGSMVDLQNALDKFSSRRSIASSGNVNGLLADLKTWLTGARTYQETCLDAFTGEVRKKMKERLSASGQLTSNSLAMVTEFSSVFDAVEKGKQMLAGVLGGSRRLLSKQEDEFPSWVGPSKRRLLQATLKGIKPNVVVAQDGTGKYKTINQAIKDIPLKNTRRFIIYIKAGIYKEKVTLTKPMSSVMLIGDGPDKTKITGADSVAAGGVNGNTFKSATLGVEGDNFICKDIAIENTAGPQGKQAVALRVSGDRSLIHNCKIDGYQDSLFAHAHRQFYRDCIISGTSDFVFGNAAAVFQSCKILARRPPVKQIEVPITAHGRMAEREPTGFVLQNCTISGDQDLSKGGTPVKVYLGRPWKKFARVLVMNSQIDSLVTPEGWSTWNNDKTSLNTLWYAELNNKGPGADTTKRVTWPGIRKITQAEADKFVAKNFILGDSWIPSSGVPYLPGMMKT